MMKRRAVFGDVHNNLKALKEMYYMLEHESLDEIYHLGDILDRGEDPMGVLDFCIEKGIEGVQGNHEGALYEKHLKTLSPPKNKDKLRSYEAVLTVSGAMEYLARQPKIRIFEDVKSIAVHAGIDPLKALADQNRMCSYIGMVNPNSPGNSRWWNTDRRGNTEEQNRAHGWVRWYELYDYPYHVYQGHTTHREAQVTTFPKQPNFKRIELDTGAWYTGVLTAAIIGPDGPEKLITTKRIREGTWSES